MVNTSCARWPREEKCENDGESGLKKFRFYLDRKDWTLEKEYKQEGITIKSTYDEEAKAYFILTQTVLDFEFESLFIELRDHTLKATPEWFSACKKLTIVKAPLDFEYDLLLIEMRDHTLEATPDWFSACKKFTIVKSEPRSKKRIMISKTGDRNEFDTRSFRNDDARLLVRQRLTDVCWVVHEVLEPQLGGIVAGRDVVFHSHVRKDKEACFISLCSTEWPGLESKENVRAEIVKGSGQVFSPDPDLVTRTYLRWVMSVDYKIPVVPVRLLMPFHIETARQYVVGLKKYLAVRRHYHSETVPE
ncbi:unnamed protein product [Darwinula stevensoni]|uniref:START domain-containing protein n=1 Tax=Darwinula stevensoni TaxID=69355 RepID=A0A7R9AEH7_9CRUS|nr:unnamed protein product [Darwinula stevensoni]CAG0902067.1 unnamed protein product [Darwinula stevensoni]